MADKQHFLPAQVEHVMLGPVELEAMEDVD